jgi:hypothetical protein
MRLGTHLPVLVLALEHELLERQDEYWEVRAESHCFVRFKRSLTRCICSAAEKLSSRTGSLPLAYRMFGLMTVARFCKSILDPVRVARAPGRVLGGACRVSLLCPFQAIIDSLHLQVLVSDGVFALGVQDVRTDDGGEILQVHLGPGLLVDVTIICRHRKHCRTEPHPPLHLLPHAESAPRYDGGCTGCSD